MKKSYIVMVAAALCVAASCDKNSHRIYQVDELGTIQSEYYVSEKGGVVDLVIVANKAGSIDPIGGEVAWASFESRSFNADSVISVRLDSNPGFRRRLDLLLRTDTRRDTVSIFQYGAVEETFEVKATSVIVYNGKTVPDSIDVDIAVPLEKVEVQTYMAGEQWISDLCLTSRWLTFRKSDNTDPDYTRRATISLSYTNGWNELEVKNITIIQAKADNTIGTTFTAEQLREAATVEGYQLPDDAFFEGVVVSTTEYGNAGDISVSDYLHGSGVIDFEPNYTTTYIQTKDGKYGFKMTAVSEEENDFERFSLVGITLSDARVYRTSDEPVRYTISGVMSSDVMSCRDFSSEMPLKEMAIEDLTDDDIYTFVTVKDCEIPMRKGPFTPINEGYTPTFSYQRVAKYPTLIRDIRGGSMYMFTNVSCSYRRDGTPLPYGSGDISGVIVHETYKSFEKDGNIGRYQIRHMTRSEIDLAMDFSDNFSALITEFRYALLPDGLQTTSLDNPILATFGNGEMCHSYGNTPSNYSPSYFYMGPCGSKYKGDYENGVGIILEDGTDYKPVEGKESKQNTDGKGWYSNDTGISWSSKYWWDSANSRGYCWLVEFSTAAVTSSDNVSMQFAMYNNSQSALSPRYWKAQYSLTTSETSKEYDDQWTDIAEFTVPDVAIWASQNDWQTLGTRVYDFPLPTEILGREKVWIRLMPRNNKAAEKSATSYDSGTIKNGSGYNTMDYFAVRYNK